MRLVAPGTDRYEAVVTADATGPWTFEIEAWGDPLESWRHDARIKIPEGQDVELMLEEGARLHEQAAANMASTDAVGTGEVGDTGDAGRLLSVAETLRSPGDPVERLSAALGSRRPRPACAPPAAHAADDVAALPAVGRSRARALRLVVRVLSALRRRDPRPAEVGHVRDRRETTAGDRRDGIRRRLHPADASDRHDVSQGSEQHPDARARRSRACRGQSAQPRAATTPSTPTSARWRTSTRSSPTANKLRPRDRPRPRAAVLARPPVGDASTPSGSRPAPTAASRTRRTRRRSTRTSTRSTSTTTTRASTPRSCASCGCG